MRIIRTILAVLATVLFAGGVVSRVAMAFDCIETKCTEILSCAEARYKFEVCGHSKRDADHDRIPCEDICGNDQEIYQARSRDGWPNDVPIAQERKIAPSLGLIPPAEAAEAPNLENQELTCAGKRTCKQMVSCNEAKFYLKFCSVKTLDGDGDGVPCNSLCR